ncbi:MAG: D-alanine--D-alanine ligase [Planctomycetota bacterium]
MKIAVIHGEVPADAGRDEQDVLVQARCVGEGLAALGHEPVALPVSLNLAEAARALAELRPALVFNLTESLAGKGSLIHLVPALLDALQIPYTGAGAAAMLLTSNKLLAKRWLAAAGLPTPPWLTEDGEAFPAAARSAADTREGQAGGNPAPDLPIAGAWLVKSVWEHASIGLDEDSVLAGPDRERLLKEMAARREALGGACLAEAFIDGREFNLSLLAGRSGQDCVCPASAAAGTSSPLVRVRAPEVLPPAEIRFDAYPPGKVRVVGYRSKWEEDSFEFNHTPRSFDFPETDAWLLARLSELALECWTLFDLRGYARVDFRVDDNNRPWILEVNANPCLSPDAGFQAATARAGLPFTEVLKRIINDMPHGAVCE